MNLGSPSHEGSITSPRSPASGFGDHNSIMSSPSQGTSGPVDYGMNNETQVSVFWLLKNWSRNFYHLQNRPPSQNQDFNSFEGFDGSSMSHTIDVNELLSKVNWSKIETNKKKKKRKEQWVTLDNNKKNFKKRERNCHALQYNCKSRLYSFFTII